MDLLIQKALKSGTTLLQLKEPPYSLSIKRHPKYPNLCQFNYDMIESPKNNILVNQCRGLILDEENDWAVVAYPFNRFFNDGEFTADTIDWNTAWVQEKIDGSLIIMYYYDNCWQIATRGSPDASGTVGDNTWMKNGEIVPMTFRRLFWHSIEYWMEGLSKSGEFNRYNTYMWELTSPYNRVVCDYTVTAPMESVDVDGNGDFVLINNLMDKTGYANDGSRVTLIGIRNNTDLYEESVNWYREDVHYVVQEFPLTNLEEVIQAAAKLNPLKQEGFVVLDENFHRIKIKSPAYVAIHHIRDGSLNRRLMETIKSGESDELLAYKILDEFPAEKKLYLEMKTKVDELILTTEQEYDKIKHIEFQKYFAIEAVKSKMSGAMFAFRKGKVSSIRKFILDLPADKLLEII